MGLLNNTHEPFDQLPKATRTFARMIVSLGEEARGHQLGMSSECLSNLTRTRKPLWPNAQEEEFKHFGMDLEFLLRQKPKWRAALKAILFQEGDIVKLGEAGEKAEDEAD